MVKLLFKACVLLAAPVAFMLVAAPMLPARADIPPSPIAAVVAKVVPSVVRIISVQPPQKPAAGDKAQVAGSAEAPPTVIGSGYIIDPSGLIVTNHHVVEHAISIFVAMPDGARLRAEAVGIPKKVDIALLRINAGRPLPALRFGDSDQLRVGDPVIAIGSPFGFDQSVTAGIVSAVNRDIMESPYDEYIQTDAAINHGNSGGPLFDITGQVVGMTSVIFAPGTGSAGVGFAIPSNEISFVVTRLKQYGEVRAGMLPIRTQAVSAMMAQALGTPEPGGALVAALGPQAEQMHAVIQPGDVITMFNNEPVLDPRDLARKAGQSAIGSRATLQIYRGGTMSSVVVPILPVDGEDQTLPGESPPPKTLGLQLASVAGNDATPGGVTVQAIDPMGSVADSGLQKDDVIVRVQDQAVTTPEQVLAALTARTAARYPYAALLIMRDKKQTWIPIALPN